MNVNAFIVSASGDKKTQFWANFDIWGLQCRPPFTDDVKFGVLEQTQGILVHAKCRLLL